MPLLIRILLAVSSGSMPMITFAQATDATPLDAVVVTATREATAVEKLPAAATVLDAQALQEQGLERIGDLSRRVPNSQLNLTPTNTYLVMRGLGTGEVRSAEQSVGIFIDGVYYGRPQLALFSFFDLDQVEILRGPQGALLGKNTIAGAINLRTRDPEGWTNLQGMAARASRDREEYRLALNIAATDTQQFRLAGLVQREEGYLFNTTTQREDLSRPGEALRGKWQWQPNAALQMQLSLSHAALRQSGDGFELIAASDQELALYRQYDPRTDIDPADRLTATDNANAAGDIRGQDAHWRLEWRRGDALWQVSAHAYRQEVSADFDADFTAIPLLTFPSTEDYRQYSLDLRRQQSLGLWDLTLGLYAFRSDLNLRVNIGLLPEGLAGLSRGVPLLGNDLLPDLLAALGPVNALASDTSRHFLDQQTHTLSGLLAARRPLSQSWSLRADLRYTRERKPGRAVLDYENSGLIFQGFLGESPYAINAQVRAAAFTPQLSVLWSPPDTGWNAYLTVAQGFKAGGFNNLAAQGDQVVFDQEDSTTLEAALRWQRGGVRAELVAFATRFDNLQVAVFDGTRFFVDNAAAAQTQGLETSLLWRPWPRLKLELAAAYLRARYREFRSAPAPAGSANDTQDLSGRTLPRAPRYSGHAGVEYRQPLPGFDLSVGVQAELRSRQFLNLDLDPLHVQAGYLRWDAQMVLRPHGLPLDLVINGENLGDTVVRREAAAAALFENTRFGSHAEPRTVGVMLRTYWEF